MIYRSNDEYAGNILVNIISIENTKKQSHLMQLYPRKKYKNFFCIKNNYYFGYVKMLDNLSKLRWIFEKKKIVKILINKKK